MQANQVRDCEQIFDMNASEMWNFAVYVYSKERNSLEPIWRRKHRNHPSSAEGRCWVPGQGHVGKAFVDNELKITGDATHEKVAAMMRPPANNMRSYDHTVYRSFASIPFGDDGDGDPCGVLVATSDHVDRFNDTNAEILRQAAAVLGTVICDRQYAERMLRN
jgi:hypothetical protein